MATGEPSGVLIGVWDESDFEQIYRKPFSKRP